MIRKALNDVRVPRIARKGDALFERQSVEIRKNELVWVTAKNKVSWRASPNMQDLLDFNDQ